MVIISKLPYTSLPTVLFQRGSVMFTDLLLAYAVKEWVTFNAFKFFARLSWLFKKSFYVVNWLNQCSYTQSSITKYHALLIWSFDLLCCHVFLAIAVTAVVCVGSLSVHLKTMPFFENWFGHVRLFNSEDTKREWCEWVFCQVYMKYASSVDKTMAQRHFFRVNSNYEISSEMVCLPKGWVSCVNSVNWYSVSKVMCAGVVWRTL